MIQSGVLFLLLAFVVPSGSPNERVNLRHLHDFNCELQAIACKKCKRTFDRKDHNGYYPFCGTKN